MNHCSPYGISDKIADVYKTVAIVSAIITFIVLTIAQPSKWIGWLIGAAMVGWMFPICLGYVVLMLECVVYGILHPKSSVFWKIIQSFKRQPKLDYIARIRNLEAQLSEVNIRCFTWEETGEELMRGIINLKFRYHKELPSDIKGKLYADLDAVVEDALTIASNHEYIDRYDEMNAIYTEFADEM